MVGQLDETGKFFGVLNYESEHPPKFNLLDSGMVKEFGVPVYHRNVKVIASEHQDRMQVIDLE